MTNHITFAQFCSAARQKGALALCLALCMPGLGLSASPKKPTIITFDAPGAGTGINQGTAGLGNNTAGAITGFYIDPSSVFHGFLRAPDGTITTFDAPGVGTGADDGTFPFGLNPGGAITGFYIDPSSVFHGFLRAPDGTITTFDAPGVATYPKCINPAGTITGSSTDASNVSHGFLRAPDGTITTFDAPGAGTGANQGTKDACVSNIDSGGAITGSYIDGRNVRHDYVRAPDGTITTFDAPGASTGADQDTQSDYNLSINSAGAIAGMYADASNVYHGFLRAPDGTITTFDAPGAGTGAGQGTMPQNINAAGTIAGWYTDKNNMHHGFLRTPDGTITTLDAPHAGKGADQGTTALGINPAGSIAGWYSDKSKVSHGFLRTP
jgi:hypothetical protein